MHVCKCHGNSFNSYRDIYLKTQIAAGSRGRKAIRIHPVGAMYDISVN